jgi:EAL domain-containing protein (putative c-di-GMP-specific phosphodiesterase class I)/DNA-binding NarL/FixJ family response regulator
VKEARILVVDDDALLRALFSDTLRDAGMDVLEAHDGEAALEVLAAERIDAVVLDSRMPRMSGLDVLAAVRADDATRTLPVLLVTGEADVADRVRGLEAGANDYVTKPVDVDELVARVRAQLRGQAAWRRIIEDRMSERTTVAEALCGIPPQPAPEQTAALVCAELLRLGHAAGAGVVAIAPHGDALLLAAAGAFAQDLPAGRPLPAALAQRLRTCADAGPWIDTPDLSEGLSEQRKFAPGRPVALAPMRSGGVLLGLLAIVAGDTAADANQSLSAAVDCAPIAAALLAPALERRHRKQRARAGLEGLLERQAFRPVFQPIVDLPTRRTVGYEVLTRFGDGTPPGLRFAEAARAGMGPDLEAATMAAALRAARPLPPDVMLSVNVSPAFVAADGLLADLVTAAGRPLVLELTEHDPISDYAAVRNALRRLGADVRVSVDDAGAGYASLHHILALEPQYVKLDRGWVTGIATDPPRQALVAALDGFARRLGCTLIAEGIETEEEAQALEVLGVGLGQGWLLGRPQDRLPAEQRDAS